ncbi:hypothetical protein EDB84DRAFT_1587266 [Lactarius hengduanensis]|nr:hypothetical protein EDB84DRAFT_1587266 [Lactarius hengduanensis]
MSDYVAPSFESLQVHSPLESLVRRTSSRRRPNITPTPLSQDGMDRYPPVPVLDAPPKHNTGLPPPSPLLHTRFRASIATQSSSNTHGRTRSHVSNGSQDISYDDDIIVSVEEMDEAVYDYEHEQGSALSSPTPGSRLLAGRTPSAVPRNVNFSRPVKPGGASEEAKRQVLARNAFRLYSAYSYYQLDSPSPSPTSDTLQVPPSPYAPPPHTPPPRTPSPLNSAPAPKGSPEQLVLADQLLQEGIQHHEANRLKEAAAAFERSAKTPGGSGVGMLMWGLTLRHGWGCPKDEVLGFSWLRRAAEAAVGDLEHARTGIDASAVRGELVLAIYEVGQCFFQGWGVKKDQKMAVSYFQVAAKLGDMDAQQELAFCYANGRGCKKDRKEAAKWYRSAVAQGASDVGLAWIHKEKFQ